MSCASPDLWEPWGAIPRATRPKVEQGPRPVRLLAAACRVVQNGPAASTTPGHLRRFASPFGSGWGLAGLDQLVYRSGVGVLWVTGAGDSRLFSGTYLFRSKL